jgi:hypothetical protein
MRALCLLLAAFALSGCGTPYGEAGSLGGVKVWEHPNNRVEVLVVGRHRTDYDQLASTWKRKADEVASMRGAKSYDIVSFSTGREILGMEVMGEGSNIERYSDDSVFWLPKIARGVIRLIDPDPPGASRRAHARQAPSRFVP